MAKKKKTTHRRRRRVSGFGSGMQGILMTVAGAVGGGIAARMAMNTLGAGRDPKLVAGGAVLAGAWIANHNKSGLMHGVGIGFATTGAVDLLQGMHVIKGVGETDTYYLNGPDGDDMNGSYQDDVVAGLDNSIIAGSMQMDDGY